MPRVEPSLGWSVLLSVLLVFFLAGCGIFQPQEGGQRAVSDGGKESLAVNLEADIADLNPTTTTDVYSFNVLNNVMEGLYRLDENENPQPAMAESVEISDDKLTYTFALRDGVEWSNGEPVTSKDFEYAWLRAMDPATAGQYSFILAQYIKGGTEFNAGEGSDRSVAIETPNDKTLRVTLTKPTPFFLGLTAFPTYFPLNQDFVEKQGDGFALSAEALLYNGPYTLSEFDPTQGATFVKNEDYWDKDNVDIERVEGRIVKDTNTVLNLYEAGELDVAKLTSEYVDRYSDSPEFLTQTKFITIYAQMNQEDPIFRNENVRRAVQTGVDRQALAGTVLNDGSEPASGYVPAGLAGPGDRTFRKAQGPVVEEFDPDRARGLYQQGVEELGREPTLEMLIDDSTPSQEIAEFLQGQLQENLGARVTVNQQPFDRKLELDNSGDYQVSISGWSADYNDPMSFLDLWTSDSPLNTSGFRNERYDQLIDEAATEADYAERMDMLLEAERLLIEEEAALAPLHFVGEAKLVKSHLKNWEEHPYGPSLEFKYARLER